MERIVFLAVIGCLFSVQAEIVLENTRFRLSVGDDATVRSLVLKGSDEELLDVREPTPVMSVTQERPFNNEIKLAHLNARTTYPANRLRREGNRLVVGFEVAPYEAVVSFKVTDDYIAFCLEDFLLTTKSYPLSPTSTKPLDFTAPPVEEFCLLRLPVRERANVGEWLNATWDERASVAVVATSPYALVAAKRHAGWRLFSATADRRVKLRGTGAALVVDSGGEAVLDRLDALERDFALPRGVANRRNPLVNASICFANGFIPETVDEYVALAKKGGFRLMLIGFANFVEDWKFRPEWKGGFPEIKKALDKVRAAGIVPGVHILHTFINQDSSLVKGGADRRIALRETYTLSREIDAGETEIEVDENPVNAERMPACRILKFGRELMTYEGFTDKRPYRFTGVKRGYRGTPASVHEEGLIGGTVWVCEYGGEDYYLKQDSDLQDIRAKFFADLWKTGMGFVYFDGSEGVQPPYAFHVPNAQYRMWKGLRPEPFLAEGAAKAHFGWHMLSGANAFDVFSPEEFKAKIVEYPLSEASLMRKDFTRVNFGWWYFWPPGAEIDGRPTCGVQLDQWEYGTSKAAAWDCPVSAQFRLPETRNHARVGDILDMMRRWEDVRAKRYLSDGQKLALRDPNRSFHLYMNEVGDYELCEITMLPEVKAVPGLRGFVFERQGQTVLAYWHMSAEANFNMKGIARTFNAANLKYFATNLTRSELVESWRTAKTK